nr:ribonuclease H-like domain-containing protein [Tanacetum cinerariifolium]
MESQSNQTIKLPIFQPGEYDLWKMRMEQYIQCIDYNLWEIIENDNVSIVTKLVDGKKTIIPPITVEEKQYENFAASNTELIEQTYKRLQKLISQLEMHGKVIPQEDINHKFLRSLSQEWTMHTIVWRNKPEIKTLSLDDLFNNLKAYESEYKEPRVNQEEKDSVNSTNRVNALSLTVNAANNKVNVVGRKSSIELPDDPNMPDLEDISIFEDSNEDVFGAEADLNNMESTFQ